MAVGEGFGKLLLFGEHSAVYGHPAVGVSLARSVTVSVEPRSGGGRRCEGIDSDDSGRLTELFDFIDRLALPFALPDDFVVTVASSVPRAAGLGSSAALATALVRAFAPGSEDREVWRWANEIERYFHGTPSGIDTGLALGGSIRAIYPRSRSIPDSRSLAGIPLVLVVGTVRRNGSTKSLVASVRSRFESGDREAVRSIDELGSIAAEAITLLDGRGSAAEIAGLALDAHEELRGLGLTTPALEAALGEGLASGALGGKLSGAGGGGAFYLVAPDRESGHRCAVRLASLARETGVAIHGLYALVEGAIVDIS